MNIILLTPKNIPFVNTILLRKRDSVNLNAWTPKNNGFGDVS